MQYDSQLVSGTLIRRYKRFLADIRLENGEEITAHCPNTGAMTHCAEPGSRVWLWDSQNPKRKYRYGWEWTECLQQYRACVNTARANQLVAELLEADGIPGYENYVLWRREPVVSDGRLDFLLRHKDSDSESPENHQQLYIEVKTVTLPRPDLQPGLACFPDTVTDRGRKHLLRLQALKREGFNTLLLFCVALEGIEQCAAAADIDHKYSHTLEQVLSSGVALMALPVHFAANGMTLQSRPLRLARMRRDESGGAWQIVPLEQQ